MKAASGDAAIRLPELQKAPETAGVYSSSYMRPFGLERFSYAYLMYSKPYITSAGDQIEGHAGGHASQSCWNVNGLA